MSPPHAGDGVKKLVRTTSACSTRGAESPKGTLFPRSAFRRAAAAPVARLPAREYGEMRLPPARRSVGVRILSRMLVLALCGTACHSAARIQGLAYAGAALLAPPSRADESHDGLLGADIARADSVGRLGYASGLASVLASDVLYLRGGLPIVRGRSAALAVVAAERLGPNTTVRWQPVRAEASVDGGSGYSYGYTFTAPPRRRRRPRCGWTATSPSGAASQRGGALRRMPSHRPQLPCRPRLQRQCCPQCQWLA